MFALILAAAGAVDGFAAGVFVGRKWAKAAVDKAVKEALEKNAKEDTKAFEDVVVTAHTVNDPGCTHTIIDPGFTHPLPTTTTTGVPVTYKSPAEIAAARIADAEHSRPKTGL